MSSSLRVTSVAVLFAAFGGSLAANDPVQIEGRWKVVSVDLAGMPVPGLEGAELVLAGGQKVFTLPDGRIEKGTYQLNATKGPAEIDATTEGIDGPESGIYAVDGDSLKLCLATGGGE